ncbi:MAG: hypothetical protein ABI772_12735 [Bacteroidota bacterium]
MKLICRNNTSLSSIYKPEEFLIPIFLAMHFSGFLVYIFYSFSLYDCTTSLMLSIDPSTKISSQLVQDCAITLSTDICKKSALF